MFREQPITRAISEIDTPSDRRNLRISAQSSTISTRSLPSSTSARVSGKLVKIELPHRDQFSAAVDTLYELRWARSIAAGHQMSAPISVKRLEISEMTRARIVYINGMLGLSTARIRAHIGPSTSG